VDPSDEWTPSAERSTADSDIRRYVRGSRAVRSGLAPDLRSAGLSRGRPGDHRTPSPSTTCRHHLPSSSPPGQMGAVLGASGSVLGIDHAEAAALGARRRPRRSGRAGPLVTDFHRGASIAPVIAKGQLGEQSLVGGAHVGGVDSSDLLHSRQVCLRTSGLLQVVGELQQGCSKVLDR
jgi:hypothetical protein